MLSNESPPDENRNRRLQELLNRNRNLSLRSRCKQLACEKSFVAPQRPGFMGNLMKEVMGKVDITVSNDGILISRDKKEGRADLIDEALKYNGQLPSNVTPIAPVQRSAPRSAPSPSPKPTSQNTPQQNPIAPAASTPREIKP